MNEEIKEKTPIRVSFYMFKNDVTQTIIILLVTKKDIEIRRKNMCLLDEIICTVIELGVVCKGMKKMFKRTSSLSKVIDEKIKNRRNKKWKKF